MSRIQELDINKEPKKMLDQLAKLGRLYEYCNVKHNILFSERLSEQKRIF